MKKNNPAEKESYFHLRNVILHGLLTKRDQNQEIRLKDNAVPVIVAPEVTPETLASWMEQSVTVTGKLYGDKQGKQWVVIDRFFEPSQGDDFFSTLPPCETAEEQLARQWKEHGYQNRLKEVIGQWPGDESFEELLRMLD